MIRLFPFTRFFLLVVAFFLFSAEKSSGKHKYVTMLWRLLTPPTIVDVQWKPFFFCCFLKDFFFRVKELFVGGERIENNKKSIRFYGENEAEKWSEWTCKQNMEVREEKKLLLVETRKKVFCYTFSSSSSISEPREKSSARCLTIFRTSWQQNSRFSRQTFMLLHVARSAKGASEKKSSRKANKLWSGVSGFCLLLAAASTTPEISFAAAASSTGNDKFLPFATENEI